MKFKNILTLNFLKINKKFSSGHPITFSVCCYENELESNESNNFQHMNFHLITSHIVCVHEWKHYRVCSLSIENKFHSINLRERKRSKKKKNLVWEISNPFFICCSTGKYVGNPIDLFLQHIFLHDKFDLICHHVPFFSSFEFSFNFVGHFEVLLLEVLLGVFM